MAALRSPSTRIRLLLAALVLAAAALVVVAPVFMLAMAPAIALFAMVANRVTNTADFRQLFKSWASILVKGMEELRAHSPVPADLKPGQKLQD